MVNNAGELFLPTFFETCGIIGIMVFRPFLVEIDFKDGIVLDPGPFQKSRINGDATVRASMQILSRRAVFSGILSIGENSLLKKFDNCSAIISVDSLYIIFTPLKLPLFNLSLPPSRAVDQKLHTEDEGHHFRLVPP